MKQILWEKSVRWLFLGVGFFQTACSVGPDFRPPNLELSTQFQGTSEEKGQLYSTSEGEASLSLWWESFHDPVLNSLIERAMQNNLEYQIAELRVREARQLLSVSRSGFFPSGSASGIYKRSRTSENSSSNSSGDSGSSSPSKSQEKNLFQTGFDSSWELDIFGGVRRQVELQQGKLQAQTEARRQTLVSLLAEVGRNYLLLRGLQHERWVVEKNLASQEQHMEIQRLRLDSGVANELSVLQAKAQYDRIESNLPILRIQQQQTIHRLSILIAQEPGSLEQELADKRSGQDVAVPVAENQIAVGLPSDLLRRRPDIRQAESNLAVASAQIGVATAMLYPRFDLAGSIGMKSEQQSSLWEGGSLYWSAGPTVTLPIFQLGALWWNVKIQKTREAEALLQYRQSVLEAFAEVEDAIVADIQGVEERESLRRAVRSNQTALDLALKLHDAGVVEFLNVLAAEQALYEAEDQLAKSELSVGLNRIALYKALGGGWETLEAQE